MSEALEPVLALLRDRGHDFFDYRREVLQRRLAERMAQVGAADGASYVARLAEDRAELTALVDTLLISTSRLFRDPATFAALEQAVIPRLFAGAAGRTLRAWVAGAATGEEAWTVAMLLDRVAARTAAEYEVFASDINVGALEHARAARYDGAEATTVPPDYRHYLVEKRGTVEVVDALRDRVTFSQHDLLGPSIAPVEAVLAQFDLVLCRNVLIYLDPRLQARLMARLVSVVPPGGVIGLGPVEQLPAGFEQALRPYPDLDRRLHLFLREGGR
jgi:two-component system, chemotaxis family, CheB/CheR fusion protein